MAIERVSGGSSLIDVLDRVLDKGIVIDAWVRISLVGIDLISEQSRVVVASSETNLQGSDAGNLAGLALRAPHVESSMKDDLHTVKPRRVRRRR